jgi:hypothetical protein
MLGRTTLRTLMVPAVGAAIAIGTAVPATAESATTQVTQFSEHFDQVMGAVAPCMTEQVRVVGDLTYVLRSTTTPTGNVLTGGHTRSNMIGIGVDTGTRYVIVDNREIETSWVASGDGFVGTGAWTFSIISTGGSGGGLITHAQEHDVLTPDGDLVVSFSNYTESCQ